jgi:hypothetical protein
MHTGDWGVSVSVLLVWILECPVDRLATTPNSLSPAASLLPGVNVTTCTANTVSQLISWVFLTLESSGLIARMCPLGDPIYTPKKK